MVASTDIKFYVHTNNNAAQLQNAYGSMIGVLDACLVNGINIGAVSSLKASGSTVTATFSNTHNLQKFQVIKITGAAQAEFNGEHRILTVLNSTTVAFELEVAPSATTATGEIQASLPPLGWEKPFSSVNLNGGGKAAYRSSNLLLSSRPFLRVVDELDPLWSSSYSKYAKVGIVENMSSIDSMSGTQCPFNESSLQKNWQAYSSNGEIFNGLAKWQYARLGNNIQASFNSSTPENGVRQWVLVGCADSFYICNGVTPTNSNDLFVNAFGCFENKLNTDLSNWFISSFLNDTKHTQGHILGFDNAIPFFNGSILLYRDYKNNKSTPAKIASTPTITGIAAQAGVVNYVIADNIIPLSENIIIETESSLQRGSLPYILRPLSINPFQHLEPTVYEGLMLLPIPVAIHTGIGEGKIGQLVFCLGEVA